MAWTLLILGFCIILTTLYLAITQQEQPHQQPQQQQQPIAPIIVNFEKNETENERNVNDTLVVEPVVYLNDLSDKIQ